VTTWDDIEAPDFTFVVRVHNFISLVAVFFHNCDSSVTLSDNEVASIVVDCADKASERECSGNCE